MKKVLSRKGLVLGIIVLFIGANIIFNINACEQFKDKTDFLNIGTPVYSTSPDWVSVAHLTYSSGAALTDLDLDGWLDIVIADGNDIARDSLKVFYNRGEGLFPGGPDWESSDTGYNGHLDVADVNGDGWSDVAVSYLGQVNNFGPIARVYLNNNGVLSSEPDWQSDVIGNAFGVDFGDMNNDGRPDLAVATGWRYDDTIPYHNYVYLNNEGTLESSASWESKYADVLKGCLWIDADNDSWLDLACIGLGEETKIYRNLGGILEKSASWQTSDSSSQDGIMLTYGDVNGDGIADLFATDNIQLGGSGLFKQYTGLDEGFFEKIYSWNYFEGYGSAVSLADVNGDKKLDLATGGWWDYTHIFINDGSGLPINTSWSSENTSVVEKIVFGDVGPERCEHMYIKSFKPDGNRKLFYLPHQQKILRILNVSLDGVMLDPFEYTYSREQGWITVNNSPSKSLDVVYYFSNSLDMVVTNWDPFIGNYLFFNQLSFDPDLDCDGNLSWSSVGYGETVKGSFTIRNIGVQFSSLNWEIESFPDWGTWSFNPENGFDLNPEEEPFTVNVEVIAPLEGDTELLGEIKVVNQDDPNDYEIIDVSLIISQLEIDSIKGGLFKVKAIIKNPDSNDSYNVNWIIKLDGNVWIGRESTGSVTIEAGKEETIVSNLILGFGKITLTVTVEISDGQSFTTKRTGSVILFFIHIKPGG